MEIIDTDHPRWDEFMNKLSEALRKQSCNGKLTLAAKILKDMGSDIDVLGTLEFCEEHGGYCSCEILLNVDHSF